MEALDYCADVLWQDLAVLWPQIRNHRIFTVAPFADNTFGWIDYRNSALQTQQDSATQALSLEAELFHRQGNFEVARAMTVAVDAVKAAYSGAPGGMSLQGAAPIRLLRETRAAATETQRAVVSSLGTGSAQFLQSLRAARANEVQAPALSGGSIVPSDPTSTWPCIGADDDPPDFALSFHFSKVKNVKELYDDWTAGALRQDGTRGPPVKALEKHYRPGVRNGKQNKGSSYRSMRYRRSRTEDNHFAKRKRVHDVIEAEGAEGVQIVRPH